MSGMFGRNLWAGDRITGSRCDPRTPLLPPWKRPVVLRFEWAWLEVEANRINLKPVAGHSRDCEHHNNRDRRYYRGVQGVRRKPPQPIRLRFGWCLLRFQRFHSPLPVPPMPPTVLAACGRHRGPRSRRIRRRLSACRWTGNRQRHSPVCCNAWLPQQRLGSGGGRGEIHRMGRVWWRWNSAHADASSSCAMYRRRAPQWTRLLQRMLRDFQWWWPGDQEHVPRGKKACDRPGSLWTGDRLPALRWAMCVAGWWSHHLPSAAKATHRHSSESAHSFDAEHVPPSSFSWLSPVFHSPCSTPSPMSTSFNQTDAARNEWISCTIERHSGQSVWLTK